MSSAQPPPYQGTQPGAPQQGMPQHGGGPYPGQYTGGQVPGGQYPGPYAGAPTGAPDPYAHAGGASAGSSAGGDQATAHYAADQYAGDQYAREPGHRDVSEASVGELLGDVTRDLSTLMRQELALAQAEVKQEVSKAAKGAGALSGAALAGYFVLLFLSIALWAGLSNIMDEGWAGLVVAVLWGVIAAVLFVTGRKQLSSVNPKPERTVDTLGQVPEALRPGHHPNAGPNTGGHR